ncbi:tetratricopeptide repeat protein [Thiocapsa rosea]|uniref:Tetratricopeptide repeat protein n=1 Tax=Thiocapsa rosea TaxID=69360 RepID=A0A495VCT5_9GAMM|nr:tetratricopeptide repeat protein [Thiocapsa rosea]RKT46590.1 tetratricopeptide repeat protein [Thiocapsa rosea]
MAERRARPLATAPSASGPSVARRRWAVGIVSGLIGLLALGLLALAQPAAFARPSPGSTIVPESAWIDDREARLELARVLAALGQVRETREQVLALAADAPRDPAQQLALANIMMTWGDFRRAEALLRPLLARDDLNAPTRRRAALDLSRVLLAAQRYEEAEQELLQALHGSGTDREAWHDLVALRIAEQDFDGALALLEGSAPVPADDPNRLRQQARALSAAGAHEAALDLQTALVEQGEERRNDAVARARSLIRLERDDQADALLERLLADDPNDIDVRYLWFTLDPDREEDPWCEAQPPRLTPEQLVRWGELDARAGRNKEAIVCLEAALEQDPTHFQARLALAETAATVRDFERSLALLDALLDDFPDTSKLQLTRARVLSWAERYADAQEAYAELREARPEDPVPTREAARVAMWSKDAGAATRLYREMQVSRQVERFQPEVETLRARVQLPAIEAALSDLGDALGEGRVYPMLGPLEAALAEEGDALTPELADRLAVLVIALRPVDRIQESAFLEEQAKLNAWHRRFRTANTRFGELIAVQPGNQEALFDQAQMQCIVGLYDESLDTYRSLLNLDPLHSRASEAVERIAVSSRPALGLNLSVWSEESPGGTRLAAIDRQHTEFAAEIPLKNGRYQVSVGQHLWQERPKPLDDVRGGDQLLGTYEAQGQSLGFSGVLSPWLSGAAEITYKDYQSSALADPTLGRAALTVNLRDWADLGLEYVRTEMLANGFALEQGILANLWRIQVAAPLRRWLDLDLLAEYQDYSDANQGIVLRGDLGAVLTDHPRELKLTLTGEYRDVRNQNVFEFDGPNLVNIQYPYWTPRDYVAGALTLQWRHDLAEFLFCGARQHVYLLKLGLGTDTDHNAGIRFEAEYRYDFAPRWSLTAQGMIQRSREWDAEGLWLGLGYRF